MIIFHKIFIGEFLSYLLLNGILRYSSHIFHIQPLCVMDMRKIPIIVFHHFYYYCLSSLVIKYQLMFHLIVLFILIYFLLSLPIVFSKTKKQRLQSVFYFTPFTYPSPTAFLYYHLFHQADFIDFLILSVIIPDFLLV